jgi:hypothetical protein
MLFSKQILIISPGFSWSHLAFPLVVDLAQVWKILHIPQVLIQAQILKMFATFVEKCKFISPKKHCSKVHKKPFWNIHK